MRVYGFGDIREEWRQNLESMAGIWIERSDLLGESWGRNVYIQVLKANNRFLMISKALQLNSDSTEISSQLKHLPKELSHFFHEYLEEGVYLYTDEIQSGDWLDRNSLLWQLFFISLSGFLRYSLVW